jgi:hypothetical protein
VFHVRDLGLYFWPRHLWLWQSWRNRDWPFWDPHVGGGQAAVADALNHFFVLPATLVRVLVPPVAGFNFWVAAPFPILAVGTWVWLRRRFSSPASAVGAAVAALAGPIASSGDFPNLSWTIALVPWVLRAVERVCEAPGARRFAGLAVCVGLQAVAGEPVTFGATAAVVIGYTVIGLPFAHWRERRGQIFRIAGAVGAGVLLAAVQFGPLFHAASRSVRGVSIDATFWSLHPLGLLEIVLPHFFGHVYHGTVETLPWVRPLNDGREPLFYSLYLGIGACALALVGGRDPAVRAWRRFWWIVAAASLVGALGEHTFVYPALQRVVPVLNSFRFPIKYLVFTVFAIGALAASGADALIRHSRAEEGMTRPIAAFALLGTTAMISAVVGLASLSDADAIATLWHATGRRAGVADPGAAAAWLNGNDPLWLRLAAFAVVAAFMLAIVWRRHRLAVLATAAICGLAVADPLAVNADLHPTMPASRLGPPEWAEATRAHPFDRVYVGGRLGKNDAPRQQLPAELIDSPTRFLPPVEYTPQEAITIYSTRFAPTPAAWGVRELISYDLPQLWPREYVRMLRRFRNAGPAGRLLFLRRTGHRYCYLPEPPFPGARPLSSPEIARPMTLYECHDEPRRLYITGASAIEPDLERQLDLMFDAGHDPLSTVVLERPSPGPAGDPQAAPAAARADVVRERHMELVVRAAVPAGGGYLTVLDSYDPFWMVEVDGRRGTLLRANGLFRAVHLAPGEHEVRFVYRPLPFYLGLAVSCSVALMLLVACVRQPARAA